MQYEMKSISNCSDSWTQNKIFGINLLAIISKRNFDSYQPHSFLNSLNHMRVICELGHLSALKTADHYNSWGTPSSILFVCPQCKDLGSALIYKCTDIFKR